MALRYQPARDGFRKQLRKHRRLLIAAGELNIENVRGADVAGRLPAVVDINESSWKAARGTNLFRSPHVRDFFMALLPRMALGGFVDLHILSIDDQPVAYELCFDLGGRFRFRR